MKTVKESFKAEKEILEEFFKNRITFVLTKQTKFNHLTQQEYTSNNIFTPEEYNSDFFKEKVKAFTLYLFSWYNLQHRNLGSPVGDFDELINFYLLNNESIGEIISLDDYINSNGRSCYKINSIHFDEANFQIDNFLKYFIDIMMAMKKIFFHPKNTFKTF